MKKVVLALIAVMLLAAPCFAVDGDIMTNDGIRIDEYGVIIPQVGVKGLAVLSTTNDTVSAIETGTTFINTNTDTVTYTLPAAAADLEFTFVAGADKAIYVDPADTTDTIRYLGMSAGDKLASTGATGDSVTVIGGDASSWYIKAMKGAFTDGN